MSERVRLFSFGGGVQSTTVLVLAAQGKVNFKNFVFANTGDDSENPATIEYMKTVAIPYAEANGLRVLIRQHNKQTLLQNLMGNNRTIAIPVYLPSGAPGTRKCTSEWKIRVVARAAKELGATRKNPGVVGIGISTDEWDRAKDSRISHIIHEFPLLQLKISRTECGNIIRAAGLPVPPKSSCWFCPYKKLSEWRTMAKENPEQFDLAAKLEAKLEAKRGTLGKDSVYLTRTLKPLKEAILPDEQLNLFDSDCSGYCWT